MELNMRKNLIAGNWKMHGNHLETIQMVQKLSYRLDPGDYERVEVVVCPPFTSLRSAQTVIEADHLLIRLGAQNVYWENEGAYTGEIAPPMLAKLSVSHVIVGHSERRQLFGETDEDVNRKVKAVLAHAMTPILCVGETGEEREQGMTETKVGTQVRAGLDGLTAEQVAATVIAYEPIWAIGTGQTATADDAESVAAFVRATVNTGWSEAADAVRILYGGSVNPGNISGFMAKRDVDGALVGGASLDPDTFASVIRYWV
jgi:triosephosphate isomerase